MIAKDHQFWIEQEENAEGMETILSHLEPWEEGYNKDTYNVLGGQFMESTLRTKISEHCEHFRQWCRNREKTGCLMTANGSHDKIVKPEDLLSYQAGPPLDIFPVAETQPMPSNAI